MEREGVSHISIPYRMTPPPSPLSPRGGVGGSKESPSVLAYISTSQEGYSPARAAPPAAQQPIAHCIYALVVHDWNTPIAIILEMFILSRLQLKTPNISEKTNATKILFCGVHYFPAFLPRGSSPPNWILIFVGLVVPTSLSV